MLAGERRIDQSRDRLPSYTEPPQETKPCRGQPSGRTRSGSHADDRGHRDGDGGLSLRPRTPPAGRLGHPRARVPDRARRFGRPGRDRRAGGSGARPGSWRPAATTSMRTSCGRSWTPRAWSARGSPTTSPRSTPRSSSRGQDATRDHRLASAADGRRAGARAAAAVPRGRRRRAARFDRRGPGDRRARRVRAARDRHGPRHRLRAAVDARSGGPRPPRHRAREVRGEGDGSRRRSKPSPSCGAARAACSA